MQDKRTDIFDVAGKQLGADVVKYYCARCNKILRTPYQITCGHRMCQTCLPNSPLRCPSCNELFDPSKKDQCFADRSCQNDMRTLRATCKCSWKGPLCDFEDHAVSCHIFNEVGRASRIISAEGIQDSLEKTQIRLGKTLAVDDRDKMLLELKNTVQHLEEMYQMQSVTLMEIRRMLNQCVENVDTLNKSIAQMHDELNLKLEILEVKTINGVVVWKVNEIQRRSRDARIGKTVSLYSPPFYTSAHGYRLCLRAYLYGDGAGKGTHISVFLVIMQSEYDDVLLWPFKHRVVISLINLDTPLKLETAITHKFVPNPQSNSFEKPKDTFNLASGFPQFASISVLTDPRFVKNDTMYFRVKLEQPDVVTSLDD